MDKLVDTQGKTFEQILNDMPTNGYAHFNLRNYQLKNNLPCFISEGSDDLEYVDSYQSLFNTVLDTIKTKDFLLAVAEKYDKDAFVEELETKDDIDYNYYYNEITGEDVGTFAENFLDSYFLGGDEVAYSIETKLADYTN